MREPANMGASIRARLLKLSKDRNQPFQLLLTRSVSNSAILCWK
jgi:hypothetical protein